MATVGDTFAESANVALPSHAPTGPNAGTSWVAEEVTGAVVAQALIAGTCGPTANEGDDRIIYTIRPNPATADVDVSVTRSTVDTGSSIRPAFLVGRFADISNYYSAGGYAAAAAADAKIFKKVAGTVTELASADTGWTNGDVLKFEIRNGAKKLYKNGAEILSTADNAITAAGRAGLGFGNAWVSTDDISGAERLDDFFFVEVAGGAVVLEGAITSASTITADLTVTRSLAGTVASASTITGALSATLALAGGVTSASTLTADLTATRELSGAIASASTLTADLGVTQSLAGAIASASTLAADLGVTMALVGTVASASTITADLTIPGDVDLAGAIVSASTITADLTVEVNTALAGDITSASTITADLTIPGAVDLAGAIASASTITADLTVTNSTALAGTVASASTLTADLTATQALAGVLTSQSVLSADLAVTLALAGAIDSQSTLTGNLQIPGSELLTGAIISVSTITANLTVSPTGVFMDGAPSWTIAPQPTAWVATNNLTR